MPYAPFNLSGKVALITGGNKGIGLGMAEALAQAGSDVAVWGRDTAANAHAEQTLRGHGVRAKAYQVDVANEDAVIHGVRDVLSDFGRIDSCFANSGIGGGAKSFSEFPTDVYRRVLSVNLDGVFFTLREVCKHMVERAQNGDPGGSLAITASTAAVHGPARNEAYAASKGACVAMTRSIAVEHARYGVRCNSILPGWIATDMTQAAQDNPVFAEKVIPRVPMRRWGEPEDFGGIAVYLASDASRYHTGDMFVIDGAYTIF
ncbi:MAG: SDR family oxidoreductase [Alphaproteobacteria bacterium]|nr:SDR family oxidoreductase [Alphaproteobacteria bacterium]